jgi:hypothetical protein
LPDPARWQDVRVSETPPPGQSPYGEQPPSGPPYSSQPPTGQPPYGAPPPGAYGQPGYSMVQDHPKAVTVLVLGILGLVLCQVLSPFAWVMGNNVVREIDANPGYYGNRGTANAGRICGIVGTVILGLSLLLVVGFVILAVVGASTTSTSP